MASGLDRLKGAARRGRDYVGDLLADHDRSVALVRWLLRVVVVVVGAVVVWRTRFYMNPDGVCYIDLGDAMARGDWESVVNRYWNPLYPFVLLLFRGVTGFSAQYEFQVVHLATFCLYLLCFVAFEYMVAQMCASRPPPPGTGEDDAPDEGDEARPVAPMPMLALVGYPFFLWFTIKLVNLYFVTPDLLVAALVFFAAALVARFRAGRLGPRGGLALGVVLGLAFLTKAAMLFVGVAFVGAAWLAGGLRRGLGTTAVAAATYGVIAGCWIAVLSADAGRFTYSDAGRLNYGWMVNGVRAFAHAGANQGDNGTLIHPPRILGRGPRVFEFARPVRGTYPLWTDPAYWYEGLDPPYVEERQRRILEQSWQRYKNIVREQGLALRMFFVALLTAFLAAGRAPHRTLWHAISRWQLLLPAIAPFLMYSLVAVKARYIGPFAFLLGMGLLQGVRVLRERRRWLLAPALAITIVLTYTYAKEAWKDEEGRWDDSQWRIAEALDEQGLEEGAPVGHVGYTFGAYWARLGRYRIVAEIPRGEDRSFRRLNEARRTRVIDDFRRAGAEALVVTGGSSPGDDWVQLAGTNTWLLMLRE